MRRNRPVAPAERLEGRRLLAAYIQGNPNPFATIQAAVDAATAGATINVEAGTYEEMVVVAKTLTLRGAKWGVDGRSNTRGAGETIVRGFLTAQSKRSTAFILNANDITLDGFTCQDNDSDPAYGVAIYMTPNKSGMDIINNVVRNNITGLYLSNNSTTNQTIIRKNFFDINNKVGGSSGRAIYTDGSFSGGTLTNVLIDQNAFFHNLGGIGTTGVEAAIDLHAGSASSQTNIDITNNTFEGNGKAILALNATDIDIIGNTVSAHEDEGSAALRFEGNCHDILIQSNNVYGQIAPAVRIDQKAVALPNDTFVITGNNFYFNNYSVNNPSEHPREAVIINAGTYNGALDCTNNWWGHSSGPGGDGPGTGDKIIRNGASATFNPWATTPFTSLQQKPYYGAASSVEATIQAEDYDHGGQGVAYSDTGVTNSGGSLRYYQGVDIAPTTDAGLGFQVQSIVPNEYLNYTVTVPVAGLFTFDARVANGGSAASTFHLDVGGSNVSGVISIPPTGGGSTFQTVTKTNINLPAGTYSLRLVFDTAGSGGLVANLNWFKFTATVPTIPPAPTLAVATANYSTIRLTWQDNSSNETGFAIDRKIGAGAFVAYATTAINVANYTDTAVIPGISYSYRVRAAGAAGNSTDSNTTAASVTPNPAITYVSDMTWQSETNGWGPVERDMSVGGINPGDGAQLTLNTVKYLKGVGAHALSEIVINLNGQYSTFMSHIGVDDWQTTNGSVVFQVLSGTTVLYTSPTMLASSPTRAISINVTGVQQLKLKVTDAGNGTSFDHADWADAKLIKSGTPASGPSGLKGVPAGPTQINLSWIDTVANETGYKILRSSDGGQNFSVIGTVAAGVTTYPSTGLTASTMYQYRVLAYNASGDGLNYSSATVSTPASEEGSSDPEPPPAEPALPQPVQLTTYTPPKPLVGLARVVADLKWSLTNENLDPRIARSYSNLLSVLDVQIKRSGR